MANEPIIHMCVAFLCPKHHTDSQGHDLLLLFLGFFRWNMSLPAHCVLLIGPLCISNEANVAATSPHHSRAVRKLVQKVYVYVYTQTL